MGRKVSIRYALRDDEHPFSEAIGVVMEVGPDPEGGQVVKILSKRGMVTEVATRDVIAAKLFPL